jgi:hypothetical protein
MHSSPYYSFLYPFIAIVATTGVFLSRSSGDGRSKFFNDGKPSPWIVSALSIFAGSFFQFWILLLPVFSLSRSAVLIILSLAISILLPVILVKSRYAVVDKFMDMVSAKLKTALFIFVTFFLLVIQPFALLYFGEKIIVQSLNGSYHFLLVFLISAAGLSTLIGGKKVVVYANAMFGVAVIVAMLGVMYLGRSFSAPVTLLQALFADGTQYFQSHNVMETNWIIGFIGFSVITWWMWWIDNGAFHFQGKQSEQRNPGTAMVASFPLIVIALVVLPAQSSGGTALLNDSASVSVIANNEFLMFFFVLGIVSVMVSAFSYSFHTVAAIVTAQYFHGNVQQNIDEKKVLIARLVIVLSALLAILCIPFAQFFGAVTLQVYVQYLACFAASMAGAFAVYLMRKKKYQAGITSGVLGGMLAGAVIVFLTYSESEFLPPWLATPYGAATGIFIFSIICSVVGSFFVEWSNVKSSVTV